MESHTDDLGTQRETLEEAELSAPNGVANIDIYKKLLTIYLIETDLANAKFLWKRIPVDLKSDNELVAIWRIGQCLWKRDFPNIYTTLNSQEWSEDTKELMDKLCEGLRKRVSKLIEDSYSIIKFEEFCKLIGVSDEQQMMEFAAVNSWKVDTENRLLRIQQDEGKNRIKTDVDDTSHHLLHSLTNYVSFLEN